MRLLIIQILFTFLAYGAMAQSRSLIVCDSLSKNPLPYTAVYIGNKPMLANEEGRFVCSQSDSLFVSVPFKSRRQYIPSVKNDTILINATIRLEPVTIVDAKSILEKVLENFPRNYNTSLYCNFNSFVRSTSTHNGKYIHFHEIVTRTCLPYELPPLGKKSMGMGTTIQGMRNSSLISKEFEINNFNLLFCLGFHLHIADVKSFNFETTESFAEGWKFVYNIPDNNYQNTGWFLVNKKDYAVTEFYQHLIPKHAETHQPNKIKKFTVQMHHFIYDKTKTAPYYSKRYFKLYQEYVLSDKEGTKIDSLKVNLDVFSYEYQYSNVEKIRPSKKALLTPLNLLKFPYDKSFWNDYKPIELTPVQKKQLTELEEKRPFQE